VLKTLSNHFKENKERFYVPKGVQEVLPVHAIYEDGIFLVRKANLFGENKYSRTWKFTDINYAVASREDKESMFLDYSELLNSLDSGAAAKLTIRARRLSKADYEANILIPMAGDSLDKYRKELNAMLLKKVTKSNAIVLDKLVTISVCKKNIEEARAYFARIGADLASHFSQLGSKCMELDVNERLKIFHDFYRPGEESAFHFDLSAAMRRGHSFKDYICPDSMEFDKNFFKVGERFGRVLFLKEYASYIKDTMIAELTELNQNMTLSIDIRPVTMEEAVREVEKRVLGVETNITNWQRRQNSNNNFSAIIPYDMEQQRKESREFLDDITSRDQRMTFATVTIVHTAATKEQLDADTESLLSTARKNLCQLAPLNFQQLDGLNTVLPFGHMKIQAVRTLTTESLAVLMPFKVQEVMDRGGIYYGQNAISHNLIMCLKEYLLNPNAFRLGVPGSGKSFGAKMELVMIALMFPDDDILVCDPEAEYAALVKALGGEVIRIAAGSDDHINAMDMVDGYGEGSDPVIDKSEFVCSLFEQLDKHGLLPEEKSIIDRCVRNVYENYQAGGKLPTLAVLREDLLLQPEPEAKRLALKMELFTSGSLNAFAHKTNVDVRNRLIDYNIMDLGAQLKTMGLLVITDAMINRVTDNWSKGKRTHIFLDEFHVVFENEYSGTFFNSAWRRFRKRNGYPTGITQNVEYLLDSVLASTMLSNSEFIVMHNQAASDREKLAQLLGISSEQMSYITNAREGEGLIRIGNAIVPFVNKFPKDTQLYKLMTTKPSDRSVGGF
jgi:type IV secretory pathway VirB4 component